MAYDEFGNLIPEELEAQEEGNKEWQPFRKLGEKLDKAKETVTKTAEALTKMVAEATDGDGNGRKEIQIPIPEEVDESKIGHFLAGAVEAGAKLNPLYQLLGYEIDVTVTSAPKEPEIEFEDSSALLEWEQYNSYAGVPTDYRDDLILKEMEEEAVEEDEEEEDGVRNIDDLIYIKQSGEFGDGENIGVFPFAPLSSYPNSTISGRGCGIASTLSFLYNAGYMTEFNSITEAAEHAADFVMNDRMEINGNHYYNSAGLLYPNFFNDYIDQQTEGKYSVNTEGIKINEEDEDYVEKVDALKTCEGAIVNIEDNGDERLFDRTEDGTKGHYMYTEYDEAKDKFLVLNSNADGAKDFAEGKLYFTFEEINKYVRNGYYMITENEEWSGENNDEESDD